MKHRSNWIFSIAPRLMFAFAIGLGFAGLVRAQNQEMQERVAEIKVAAARNKQALAQYTWVEQVTISLKGEQKKQESFQVRLGPDGQPQKSLIGAPAPEEPSGGRLKRHIVEKGVRRADKVADTALCSPRPGSHRPGLPERQRAYGARSWGARTIPPDNLQLHKTRRQDDSDHG